MQHDEFLEILERVGISLLDGEDGLESIGPIMERLGLSPSMTDGESLESRVHPEDRKTFRSLRLVSAKEGERSAEYRVRSVSGEWRWMRSRIISVKGNEEAAAVSIRIDEDITGRKREEQELRSELQEAERRYDLAESMRIAELVASASPDLASTVSAVLNQARLNIPFVSASAYSKQETGLETVGSFPDREGAPIKPEPSSRLWEVISSRSPLFIDDASGLPRTPREVDCSWLAVPLVLRGEALGALEFWIPANDARRRDHAWTAMVFGDMLAIELDAERHRRDLVEEANTDHLTGLLTRRSFTRIASKLLSRLVEREQSVSVILADVDHFKSFNDRFGHLKGDEILRGVAQVLKEGLRQEDVICRFGGEEIIALLPGTKESIAFEVAERLREKLERRPFAGIDESVTASFGIAAGEASADESIERLIERADRAMYRAKEEGRNRVVIADWADAGPLRPPA
jgi:diguanylate cyclase (GGDEF)-like protein/PAS domain S-box-containing protein